MTKRTYNKPVDGRRVNANLPEGTTHKASILGGGNVSKGIRIAVDTCPTLTPDNDNRVDQPSAPEASPEPAVPAKRTYTKSVGGKDVKVYLRASDIEKALELGGGNISKGLRVALAQASGEQVADPVNPEGLLMDISGTARLLGVTTRTVGALCEFGDLPKAFATLNTNLGPLCFWRRSDILAWVND